MSTTVSTVHQLYPAALTRPTRAPVSVMTLSPTSTPWAVPLFRVREEVQLVTACSVTSAVSSSQSKDMGRRFSSSRSWAFSSSVSSAWRFSDRRRAFSRLSSAFSSSSAVMSAK